jgi:tetratricopeptide (TPR) repeat protein
MKFPNMIPLPSSLRVALAAATLAVIAAPQSRAADPTRIVFQNGRAVDIAAVAVQGDNLVIRFPADGFLAGQTFPLATADHVYGEKPVSLNAGIGFLLSGQPAECRKILEPILESQRVTAAIPGNHWLDAARATLVAYAIEGKATECTALGNEISDATPTPGNDPFVALGKALLLPSSTKLEERDTALGDLTTGNLPAQLCAYASFYRANLLKTAKKEAEALEAYLMVPCLFPAGSLMLNSAAELNASEILAARGRREEAVALLNAAVRDAAGTPLANEAAKRLQSLK